MGCGSFSPFIWPRSSDLIESEFEPLLRALSLFLSPVSSLQGQCWSHPWHFRVPAPGYTTTPSLFSSVAPLLLSGSWTSGMHLTAHSGAHSHLSLSHAGNHVPSGFPLPLNGAHCPPTVFHFLFLLPRVPLWALNGTSYPLNARLCVLCQASALSQ